MVKRSGTRGLIRNAPGGQLTPARQLLQRPSRIPICVATGGTGIGNLQLFGGHGRNELERMTADVHIGDLLRDFRHVARRALVSRRSHRMMGMRLNRGCVRTIGRTGAVTGQAHYIRRTNQVGVVGRPVNIVATEAGDAPRIHQALGEIIALHAIFVPGTVGVVGEALLAGFEFFELPEIFQILTHVETHRPCKIPARDQRLKGLSLRMALDTGIVRAHRIEPRRIDDIRARRARRMRRTWPMTLLTTHVPFRDSPGLRVVIYRMAPIAQGTRRTRRIFTRVDGGPPISSHRYVIGPPNLIHHVPLRTQREVIVADLLKVALLPLAAVGERDVLLLEGNERIGFRKVRQDRTYETKLHHDI